MDWKITKARKGLKGTIDVPPDKSISHRAVMFGAISQGECRIYNFLLGEDCLRTLNAFEAMDIDVERENKSLIVKGKGLRGLKDPRSPLYMGNSGTSMRIISGILVGQDFKTVLTGDESLSKRPMGRIIEPLGLMGGKIRSDEGNGRAPLAVEGVGTALKSIAYRLPVASAQVKSCILAAGLFAKGKTSVKEPYQSRDHTERMLEYFSADIRRKGLRTEINGGKELVPKEISIPGDISSAAFFIVGALLAEGSKITVKKVGINPTRIGLLNILSRMGAGIKILDKRGGLEPEADLEITSSSLRGTVVREKEVPLMIDEIPILAVAALTAEGETVIKGIKELRVKESDRVRSLELNLRKMGIEIKVTADSLSIPGGNKHICSAEFDSFGDHRIAMSMAIASLIGDGESVIRDVSCVDTSYPDFMGDLEILLR